MDKKKGKNVIDSLEEMRGCYLLNLRKEINNEWSLFKRGYFTKEELGNDIENLEKYLHYSLRKNLTELYLF